VHVVGVGPAGCAVAIALARRGVPVTLARSVTEPARHGGESLPPAIAQLLSGLDLLDDFARGPHLPCFGNESAWGYPALRMHSFMTSPYGWGWHIDRPAFDRMMLNAAERAGARVVDSSPVDPAFVVDATGRAASVAHARGVVRMVVDHLIAVVSVWKTSSARIQSSTSLIEAAEDGYWYSSPLPFNRMFCLYVTDAALWAGTRVDAIDAWLGRLSRTAHTSRRLADLDLAQDLRMVAAGTSRLEFVRGAGWLAVGDAAACRDPLSSGGIYEAVRSGVRAADAIARHLDGEIGALEQYGDDVVGRFTRDLERRRRIYSREQRWPESPFWADRRKSVALCQPDMSI
jgi:flavin-dependent dehydrogenase